MKNKIKVILELVKIRITSLVALTTIFGYICFQGEIRIDMFVAAFGLFLLACGSASINHLQEQKIDAAMDRTKNRPLPAGKISFDEALILAAILSVVGAVILYFSGGLLSMILGIIALLWYNVVYTPLKKKTAFAVVPGSVIGALPPVVGWTAAGGSLFDPRIAIIALFFFIWQIPHFWLLLLVFNKDYEKAGIPTLSKKFNDLQLARITFVWTVTTALTSLLFPMYNVMKISFASYMIVFFSFSLVLISAGLLRKDLSKKIFRVTFHGINAFVLLVIILTSLDKLRIFVK